MPGHLEKKILSEEASLDVSSRRAGARKRDVADIIAHAAGIYDEEWDLELYNDSKFIKGYLCGRMHTLCASMDIYTPGCPMYIDLCICMVQSLGKACAL